MEDQETRKPANYGSSDLQKNVGARSTWIRLFFMLVFAFIYGVSRLVTGAVIVIQFFQVLFTGDTNDNLKSLGHSLAIYSYEIVNYLTFNTEVRPYPLDAEWPREWSGNVTGDEDYR